jgi:hypothetical protein
MLYMVMKLSSVRNTLRLLECQKQIAQEHILPFLSVFFLYLTFSILSLLFRISIFVCQLTFIFSFLPSFRPSINPSFLHSFLFCRPVLIGDFRPILMQSGLPSIRKPSYAAQIYLSNSLLLSNFSV